MFHTEWKSLFRLAMDQINAANIPSSTWAFGGGTVLMLYYKHRYSKDIDIFFYDNQFLSYLSPRLNDAVETSLGGYVEQANFTKLYFGQGEVDFILSPQITEFRPTWESICGARIQVGHPVEIVAKKIFYRAEDFKPRDMVDLAAVYQHEPRELVASWPAFASQMNDLAYRIEELQSSGRYDEEIQKIQLTRHGKKICEEAPALCQTFLDDIRALKERNRPPSLRM